MEQTLAMQAQITQLCGSLGLAVPGFFVLESPHGGMTHGIALAVPLSPALVDEVAAGGCPTHSYFHHYRTVNAHLDSCMLRVGLLLQAMGYRYLPVAASQSIPTVEDPHGYHGRFSHKQGACMAGLGWMDCNGLFLHTRYGPRIRLGTVLTDCPVATENPATLSNDSCAGCMKCRDACPAGAIYGRVYTPGLAEFSLVDPQRCSQHMKSAYQKIGRGAVCGICMAVCPRGQQKP